MASWWYCVAHVDLLWFRYSVYGPHRKLIDHDSLSIASRISVSNACSPGFEVCDYPEHCALCWHSPTNAVYIWIDQHDPSTFACGRRRTIHLLRYLYPKYGSSLIGRRWMSAWSAGSAFATDGSKISPPCDTCFT